MKRKIGIIGCGHLGLAIALKLKEKTANELFISYSGKTLTLERIKTVGLEQNISTNESIAENCDIIFLFIRPDQVKNLSIIIPKSVNVISGLAGISMNTLSEKFKCNISRIMPTNPDSIYDEVGCSAVYNMNIELEEIMKNLNIKTIQIVNEDDFHVFTAMSVLPAVIIQSELINLRFDKNEIIEKYKNMEEIIHWSVKNTPRLKSDKERNEYLSKIATAKGITERMIKSLKERMNIIEALSEGIKRGKEIEEAR